MAVGWNAVAETNQSLSVVRKCADKPGRRLQPRCQQSLRQCDERCCYGKRAVAANFRRDANEPDLDWWIEWDVDSAGGEHATALVSMVSRTNEALGRCA